MPDCSQIPGLHFRNLKNICLTYVKYYDINPQITRTDETDVKFFSNPYFFKTFNFVDQSFDEEIGFRTDSRHNLIADRDLKENNPNKM